MQTASVVGTAAGATAWVPVDSTKESIGISLGCTISSGASLTYKVQHTFDNPWDLVPVGITRSTTTASLTLPNHGLVAGDSLIVEGAGAPFDGSYAVASVTDANIVTYTVANSGLTTANPGAIAAKIRVFDHSSITGKTANSDGNYAFPIAACRINITTYASGRVTLTVRQGG